MQQATPTVLPGNVGFAGIPAGGLSELISELITAGVREGLIVYDEDAGLAVMNELPTADALAIYEFLKWLNSDEGIRSQRTPAGTDKIGEAQRLAAAHPRYRLLVEKGCLEARLRAPGGFETGGWAEVHRLSDLWLQVGKREEDLKYALGHGEAQSAALKALGVETQFVGVYPWGPAIELLPDIALAATGHATAPVAERIMPLLERHVRIRTGANSGPIWFGPLVTAFSLKLWESLEDSGETPLENLLLILKSSVPKLPKEFGEASGETKSRAAAYLRTVRVNTRTNESQPRGTKGGPAKSPWQAALDFAEIFGLKGLPKKGNATRPLKSLA